VTTQALPIKIAARRYVAFLFSSKVLSLVISIIEEMVIPGEIKSQMNNELLSKRRLKIFPNTLEFKAFVALSTSTLKYSEKKYKNPKIMELIIAPENILKKSFL
jgi:hypothetical protein